jgi:hypothetical protein
MKNITDKIQFDETLPLSQQNAEFQQWCNKNVNSQINDKTEIKEVDEYKRPALYSVLVDAFIVEVQPIYKNQSQSDWSCSDFQITIKTV